MRVKRIMILGGAANEVLAPSVRAVMAEAGFEGPVEPVLHAQGEGIWMVLISIPPTAFVTALASAAGTDAYGALKRLFEHLRIALRQPEGSHGQIYVRSDAVTKDEWETSGRKGPMPGWRPIDSKAPEAMFSTRVDEKQLRLQIEEIAEQPEQDRPE